MSAHAENPTTAAATPATLGYHMPAEWEPHEATWLSWPRPDGISFPGCYEKVVPTLAKMVHALAGSEKVNINVCDAAHEALVRKHLAKANAKSDHVTFHHIPTNEPWCRDHGPIYLTRAEQPQMAIVDWDYNAWGWKYPPFDFDDDVPKRIAELQQLPIFFPKMVLEGGSIDVNGTGTLLTTKSCLLNPNRNPDLSQKQIEQRLRDFLGVKHILWLGDGIEGDDTDGHVDDLTRFIDRSTVITVIEEDSNDRNHEPLQQNLDALHTMETEDGTPIAVHTLPMPRKIVRDGQRLPGELRQLLYRQQSGAAAGVRGCQRSSWAVAVLEKAFPNRKVVPIDCRGVAFGASARFIVSPSNSSLLPP